MTLTDALFAVIAALAALTQTVAGFGFMLVASTLGALVMPMPEVVPLALPLSLVSTTWVAVDQRRLVDRRLILRTILPAMALGSGLGFLLNGALPEALMRGLLGVIVLGFVVLRLTRRARTPRPWTVWQRTPVIVAAGIAQGLFGTGGPLLVMAVEGMGLAHGQFRATLMAVWTLINTALVTAIVVGGRYDAALLWRFVIALPAVAAGVFAGQHLHKRLSPERFQIAVYMMLALAAAGLLWPKG